MRPVLAATAAVLLIGAFRAPLVPVIAGAALAGAWCGWRALARRRAL